MLKLRVLVNVVFGLGCVVLAASACRDKPTQVSEDSELMYGFLNNRTASLLSLNPKDKVLVCGTSQRNLRDMAFVSVKKWSEASGRADLIVEQAESCDQRRQFAGSIAVAYNGPSCQGNVLGYHTQSGQHHDIVSCPLASNSDEASTMLHEVGHAWGLCDQYDANNASKITFHGNCQSQYRSEFAARSIMGGGYRNSPNGLTEDDFLGIRIGACRPDIKSNATWLKAHPEEVAAWKTPAFLAEVARIQKSGAPILAECLAGATTPKPEPKPEPKPDPVPGPSPLPPENGNLCDRLTQVVDSPNNFFFIWKDIRFALSGAAADLDQISFVRWSIHESFPNTIKSYSRQNGFATMTLYTKMDGWESAPAEVNLKSGAKCQVKGTVVQL